MKTETKIIFCMLLISLPACYVTMAPSIILAVIYTMQIVAETELSNKKDIAAIHSKLRLMQDPMVAFGGVLERIEKLEKKPDAEDSIVRLWDKLDEIETNLNGVNLKMGMMR